MPKFKDSVREELITKMTAADIDAVGQVDAILDVMEKAQEQVMAEYEELKNENDTAVLISRGIQPLTAEETKFYNEVQKAGGFDKDITWPETILEKVFDDIEKEHPLLKLVNFTHTVGKVKVIRSRRKGKAVFGPLHKNMEGQLDAEFDAKEFTQLALTAFMLISNDTLDLGPRWIHRYVQLCLREAIADAWETAIVAGNGNNQPIGLLKDLDKPVQGGVYQDKDSAGTLTFKDAPTMVKELAGVLKKMSSYTHKIGDKDEQGETKYRKVLGKVYLIVNPVNYYDIIARVTTQNANGVFVSNLPFISQDRIIESLDVPENKLIAFIEGEYDATQSRAEKVSQYSELFAMQRATLYAVDMLGNGQPANNFAAQVYDVNITPGA